MIGCSAGVKRIRRNAEQERLQAAEVDEAVEIQREVAIHAGVSVESTESKEVFSERIADGIGKGVVVLRLVKVVAVVRSDAYALKVETIGVGREVVAG